MSGPVTDDAPGDGIVSSLQSYRLARWVLVALALLVATGVAVAVLGPPKARPWRCHHAVERPTVHEAIDAYYASCWRQPSELKPAATNDEVTADQGYYDMDEFGVRYDDATRFLLVGRTTPHGPWIVLGENSGP